jgi:diguanylate cyclase (GGDEF)-like protein
MTRLTSQVYYSEMEYLIHVIQELSLARTLNEIIDIVRFSARKLANSDGATFILRDNGQCYYVDEDAIAPLWKGKRFPMSICIGGWTMNNKKPAIIPHVFEDSRIPFEAYEPTFVKSLVCVPIRRLDPIAAIGVYWAVPHEPTEDEIKLLQALADSTAIAMENVQVYAELEQRVKDRTSELEEANWHLKEEIKHRKEAEEKIRHLSLTDELTGIYNRRGFFFLTEQILKTAQRNQIPCLLLFMDLDGLKKVNDQLGHQVGDAMIKDAAYLLKKTFRDTDVTARLGGDEFVVFIPNYDGGVYSVNERLQDSLREFNSNHQEYKLSFSLGIVDINDYPYANIDVLILRADELMYEHKKMRKMTRVA